MYAIIEDGGKQYKVTEGDNLLVEIRDLAEDQTEIKFDQVLMVGEGDAAKIGTPYLPGASVTATILERLKTPKVVGIKFSRRKGYKKKFGHRQNMLKVKVSAVSA